MSGSQAPDRPGGRFPGFDVVTQAAHWDPVTTGVVLSRLAIPPAVRFFTPAEQAIATALCDRLLGQDLAGQDLAGQDLPGQDVRDQNDEPAVPVVNLIDARLAEKQTDGWRYEDMPEDGQAWRDSLTALDADATARFGSGFAACTAERQVKLIQAVQDLGAGDWHGLHAARVWSLWTRYACTAFYAHPSAWNEIGFPGPAYPRGYKNPGVGTREPFEVRDTRPSDDPARRGGR